MKFEKDATYVVALGGLGEVGKNSRLCYSRYIFLKRK